MSYFFLNITNEKENIFVCSALVVYIIYYMYYNRKKNLISNNYNY